MNIDKTLILKKLHDHDLTINELEADTERDVRHNYKEATGNIPFRLPCDKYLIMNSDGDVVHIGNLHTAQSFVVNYQVKE